MTASRPSPEGGRMLLDCCPPWLQRLYRVLADAARAGEAAPANRDLGERFGCSAGQISTGIGKLEALGLVRVKRFVNARVIEIVAAGVTTVNRGSSAPHWRTRAQDPSWRPAPRKRRDARQMAGDQIDPGTVPARVFRDPCPRCGTRGDAGCAHGRAGVNW